jgi:hypothetical protein
MGSMFSKAAAETCSQSELVVVNCKTERRPLTAVIVRKMPNTLDLAQAEPTRDSVMLRREQCAWYVGAE